MNITAAKNRLAIDASDAAKAVLEDYSESLEAGGKPFILEESHPGLREMAMGAEREPTKFWSKVAKLPRATPPKGIQRLLQRSFPDEAQNIAFSHRTAGVRSLGRPRYVATATAMAAWPLAKRKRGCRRPGGWAKGRPKERAYSVRLLEHSVRQPDPYYAVEDGWVIRRLGPHCERIELAEFLRAMGRETANLHLAHLISGPRCCSI